MAKSIVIEKNKLLSSLEKQLKECMIDLRRKDKRAEKDDNLWNDGEFNDDYHNLKGFIEGLESAIAIVGEFK